MNTQTEEWRPINGYENLYEISSKGRVKSLNYNKTYKEQILKPSLQKGYYRVTLCKNGEHKKYFVHQLVGTAFIPNPDGKPFINHRDEIRDHNWLENLEWCDNKYNSNYGHCREKISKANTNNPKTSTPIKCLDLETNKETIYPSIREAARQMNILYGSIRDNMTKCNSPYKKRYVFTEV